MARGRFRRGGMGLQELDVGGMDVQCIGVARFATVAERPRFLARPGAGPLYCDDSFASTEVFSK